MIGQQWSLVENSSRAPYGCYLFKTINKIQSGPLLDCKRHGHMIAATDEEAFSRASIEFLPHGIDQRAFQACNIFCAQNNLHKRAIVEKFKCPDDKVRVTGNARSDFYSTKAIAKYKPRLRKIKKDLAPYILVNTNFTFTNSVWGDPNQVAQNMIQAGTLDLDNQEQVNFIKEYVEYEKEAGKQLISLINWILKNMKDIRVVIRPHPAENPDNWRKHFYKFSACSIVTGEAPMPWILGSKLVLHTNCTTGLEAALLGHPNINLFPGNQAAWSKRHIMQQINATVENWEDAAELIKRFFISKEGRTPLMPDDKKITHLFPGIRNGTCSENIANELVHLFQEQGISADSPNHWGNETVIWGKYPRTKTQVKKFSVSDEELRQRFSELSSLANIKFNGNILKLDDSVFLFLPDH